MDHNSDNQPSDSESSESSRSLPIVPKAKSPLAVRLKAGLAIVHRRGYQWIEAVVECGKILLEARHGEGKDDWAGWLRENFSEVSRDTTENWMRIASEWPWVQMHAAHMGKVSVDGLLKIIRSRKLMSPRASAIAKIRDSIPDLVDHWEDGEIEIFSSALSIVLNHVHREEIKPLARILHGPVVRQQKPRLSKMQESIARSSILATGCKRLPYLLLRELAEQDHEGTEKECVTLFDVLDGPALDHFCEQRNALWQELADAKKEWSEISKQIAKLEEKLDDRPVRKDEVSPIVTEIETLRKNNAKKERRFNEAQDAMLAFRKASIVAA